MVTCSHATTEGMSICVKEVSSPYKLASHIEGGSSSFVLLLCMHWQNKAGRDVEMYSSSIEVCCFCMILTSKVP